MILPGVRSALYDVVKLKGHNPEEYDPWYFPSVEDYGKVNHDVSSVPDDQH